MAKTYVFRLTSEGVRELESDLKGMGETGQHALDALSAKVPGLGESFDQAKKKAAEARQNLEDFGSRGSQSLGLLSGAAATASGVLAAFGVTLGLAAAVEFGKQVLSQATALKEHAASTGVSTDALQAWQNVLVATGVSTEEADRILNIFTRSIGQAKEQAGPARDALAQLFDLGGPSLDQLKSSGIEALVPQIAKALLNVKDATTQTRLEFTLFGRAGADVAAALATLANPAATLVEQQRALGLIMGRDVIDAASLAEQKIGEAWKSIEVQAAPVIASIAEGISGIADWLSHASTNLQHFRDLMNAPFSAGGVLDLLKSLPGPFPFAGIEKFTPAKQNRSGFTFEGPPVPAGFDTEGSGTGFTFEEPPAPRPGSFDDAGWQKFLAYQQDQAHLAGLSATEAGAERDAISAAAEKLKLQGNASAAVNLTYKDAVGILNAQELAQARAYGIEQARGTEAKKVKETFDQYLASLRQEAVLAGQPVAEKQDELAVIKAAQIAQKESGVQARDLVKTYSDAVGVLGAQHVAQVRNAEDQARTNALALEQKTQLSDLNVLLGTAVDHRQLEAAILQKQHELNRTLTDDERARLAQIQRLTDQLKVTADLSNLREQASVGENVPVDQQQRVLDILRLIHSVHGNISDDQLREYAQLLDIEKETERWKQVFLDVRNAEKDAISEFLTTGNAGKSLQDFGKNFGKVIADQFADALSKGLDAITQPAVDSIKSAVGDLEKFLGVNTQTTAAEQQLVATNTNTAALNQLTAALSGAALPGAVPGVSGSATPGGSSILSQFFQDNPAIGQAFSGGLQGFGMSSIVNSIMGGSQMGSQIGGTLGGALGNVVGGPIGSMIGSILGSVVGGLFKGLGKQSDDRAYAEFGAGGLSATFDGSKATGQTTQLAQQAASDLESIIGALDSAGVVFNQSVQRIGIGVRDQPGYQLSGGAYTFAGTKGDPQSVVMAAVQELLKSATINDTALKQVLTTNTFASAQDLEEAASFVKNTYDVIISGAPALNSVQQQMKQLSADFDTAAQEAQKLGLSVAAMQEGEAKSINASVRQQILSITDPLQAALEDEAASAQARLDAAKKFGADINQVEQLNALEREKIIEQYAQQTIQNLQSLVQDLTMGSDSPLAPDQQYAAALANYQAALAKAQGSGSQQDIQAFEQAAQALAPIARSFLGDSETYGSLVQQILDAVQAFETAAGTGNDAALQSALDALANQQQQSTGAGGSSGDTGAGPAASFDLSGLLAAMQAVAPAIVADADTNAANVVAAVSASAQLYRYPGGEQIAGVSPTHAAAAGGDNTALLRLIATKLEAIASKLDMGSAQTATALTEIYDSLDALRSDTRNNNAYVAAAIRRKA